MQSLRGFSLEVRVVGQTWAFDASFDSQQLDAAGGSGPYRLPCANCQQLLPLFGVQMSVVGCDADTVTVPPLPQHPSW